MLTMTVMQNEREALGQFSTEPTEAKDVLSQLRHLHHTLQECHWRVQVVDHALCAQDGKEHHGLQNQTEYDHSFELEATKDYGLQDQTKNEDRLQLKGVKECSPKNKDEEDQYFEKPVKETMDCKTRLKNDAPQPTKDQNCQSGGNEECENLIDENCKGQKSAKEKHSFLDITSKDLKLSVCEDDNIQDLSSDNKKNTDSITDVYNLSTIGLSECSLCDIEKDFHTETKKESYINNSCKKCWNDETCLSERKQSKYLTRQECINTVMEEDRLLLHPNEQLSSITTPLYDFQDLSFPESNAMTDLNYQQVQLADADVTYFRKQGRKKEKQNRSYDIQELENRFCCKGDITLSANTKKEDTSEEQHLKNEKIQGAHVDPAPEVAQKMDIIWEALESLRTNFFALRSSLVNNSNIFHSHESLDESHINSGESGNVHSILEDHISETTLFHRIPYEQSLLETLPFRNHHHCVCQKQISSHTPLEKTVNSAALSDKLSPKTHLRNWQDNCLCVVMAVLLLLLFLFLASCLLLILPVVSVSVRTAGGLPAF